MDTITKSTKKSLLAATVVALLALVAIAGAVTYSADDSSAADSVNYNYLEGSVTVSSATASANFFIDVEDATSDSTVTVPADVTYTGTVSFGYHSNVNGVNYDVAYTTLTFTNGISNASVTYNLADSSVSVSTNAADATVDVTLVTGTLYLSSAVSGTVKAADATVTLDKVTNLAVTVSDAKAYLSSAVDSANNVLAVTGTVTVAGTAYECGALTIDTDAELIVAAGATLTTVAMADHTLGFDYQTTATSVAIAGNTYAPANGKITVAGLNSADGANKMVLTFDSTTTLPVASTVVMEVITADGKYYVVPTAILATDATAGVLSVNDAGTGYTLKINANDIAASTGSVKLYSSTGTEVADAVSAPAQGIFEVTLTGFTSTALTQTFYLAVTDDNGNTLVYSIAATAKYTDSELVAGSYTFKQATSNAATLIDGAVATVAIADDANVTVASISVNGKLTVKGTVNATVSTYYVTSAPTTAKYSYATITNAGEIDVSAGVMTIDAGKEGDTTVIPTAGAFPTTGVTAAYYYNTKAADKDPYFTATYTDFVSAVNAAAALKAAVTVTVLGTLTLTEDYTIPTGTSATAKLAVVMGAGAILNLGTIGDNAKTVVLTVPDTSSTGFNTLTADNGAIVVVNGSLVIAKLTSDSYTYEAVSGQNYYKGVKAAVFMYDDTNGTYTDLATALVAAKSGDTVTLRYSAVLIKDATIASGVTLAMGAYDVVVGSYATADGKTAVNGTATLTVAGTITGTGTIYILKGSEADVNVSDATGDDYNYQLGIVQGATTGIDTVAVANNVDGGKLVIGKDATLANIEVDFVSGALVVDGTMTSNLFNLYMGYMDAGAPTTATDTVAADFAITVNGKLTLDFPVGGVLTIGTLDSLTIDVNGTLNMLVDIKNNGAMTVTVAKDATVVIDGASTITNNNAASKLTMTVNGTLAYVEDKALTIVNTASKTCNITVAGTLGLAKITDTAETASVTVTGAFTVADVSRVNTMTVSAGSFAAGKTFNVVKTLTVSGTATFTAAGTEEGIMEAIVSDSASLTETGDTEIGTLTVSGTATVMGVAPTTAGTGATTVGIIYVNQLAVGTATKDLAASTNGATVTVTLSDNTYSTTTIYAYGIVYGTAANVHVAAATAANLVKTELYLVGNNENFLYATEYAVGSNTYLVLETLDITGYKMSGWFNAAAGGSAVTSTSKIADNVSVYGVFEPKTYTVTFTYLQGAIYLVNGAQVQSGPQTYAYGTELTVSVIAASGYDASKATIQLNTTSPSTSPITYKVTDDANFTAAGVTEKTASKDNGLSLTDILLIILVIITAIVAIAVVLKLARS